ncbi:radical SAM/SPASM domain-containing protein [Phaeovulum vinaykumarii]|uniref:Radical SAM core domain-containing protein n=1 Tax=Phaeovulum vinaykumarii TaxID=407234 RepID=A0A1N7JMA4_9RHOB|nr:radical SAM protein [Phaeovulum vinaykumarii]SIS50401.1 uncharacterized protein SAMN05421795_101151 [Phaeovulum vinaykumarii]SOB90246.1 uncharacterized protein SAMN05878426_101151 [Phaeovulum vinaykumarii]
MNVLTFRTARGHYAYDGASNLLAEVGPRIAQALRAQGAESCDPVPASGPEPYPDPDPAAEAAIAQARKGLGLFRPAPGGAPEPALEPAALHDALARGRRTLMLQLTDACNLRCGYCVYAGTHPGRPAHGTTQMSPAVAEAAIAEFFAHATQTEGPLGLGFYGGEPLLNRKVMKFALDLFRSRAGGREILPALTTNGTLLNGAAGDILAGNAVAVMVSLDGPPRIHDAQRRLRRGGGSFDRVVANLRALQARHPAWFDTHVQLSVTLGPETDLAALDAFFTEFPVARLSANALETPTGTAPPAQDQVETMLARHLNGARAGRLGRRAPEMRLAEALFAPALRKIHRRRPQAPDTGPFTPGGACIPGVDKTFVSPKGRYFLCEKLDGQDAAAIGDVEHGLDVAAAQAVLTRFHALLGDECRGCWAFRLCGICPAHVIRDGRFDPEARRAACALRKRGLARLMRHYCEIREVAPDALGP